MEKKKFICIVCPQGCNLELEINEGKYSCTGNRCKRGLEYAINECTDPKRMITTTVRILNSTNDLIPVISTEAIPKREFRKCLEVLYEMKIDAPIKMGDIIVKNILGTNVDIVAARNMKLIKKEIV